MALSDKYVRLLPATLAPATGVLTLSGNAVAAETVTIGSKVYTWRAAVGATANEVLVGANASASIDNLIAAINGAAGGGSTYGSATVASTEVTAAAGAGDTMDVTATVAGPTGTVATTETMTNGSFAAVKLVGGGALTSAAPSLTSKAAYKKRPFYADRALATVWNPAGAGTVNIPVYLWGWSEADQRGHYIGALNGATAIPEVTGTTDVVSYSEMLAGISPYDAFYAQLGTLGGTATEAVVGLHFLRPGDEG